MKKIEARETAQVVFDLSIDEVYQYFITSRAAMRVQPSTMKYYTYFLPKYVDWLKENGITNLEAAANSRTVEAFLMYIAGLHAFGKEKALTDSTVHIYARTIRTMLRFAFENEWLKQLPHFKMPIIHKTKLPVLNEDNIITVVQACESTRDKVIVLLFIATGIRRGEMAALRWGDIDFSRLSVEILEGKGKKYRSVKFDPETGRILLRYKIELGNKAGPKEPVIQNQDGYRLAPEGYRALFQRLEKKTGIHFSAHALRRTFAKMCVKQGMDLIYIQNLMGHAQPDTTMRYIQQLDDEDVKKAYDEHAPLAEIARQALRNRPRKSNRE